MECLEAEEWGGGAADHVRSAKEGVLVLLLQLLPAAPPSLAHYLLGYNVTDDV